MVTRRDLMCAVMSGDVKKVKKILKTYKSNKLDVKLSELLFTLALKPKKFEISSLLIKYTASRKNNKKASSFFTLPFLYAARHGQLKVIKNLVKKGANVNGQVKNGWTALHYAAIHKNVSMVRYLLKQGALISFKDRGNRNPEFTALHYTCVIGAIKSAKILVKHNSEAVNPKEDNAIHPIHLSVSFSKSKVTAFLIPHTVNIDARFSKYYYKLRFDPFVQSFGSSEKGATSLHWAIAKNDIISTKLLIDNGANVNLKTTSGITPLMVAAQRSNLDLFLLILKLTPNVNDTDNSGNTALHYIYYNREMHHSRYAYYSSPERLLDTKKIEHLHNAGADVSAKCFFDYLPNLTSVLDLTIYFVNHLAVRYLLYRTFVGCEQLDYSKVELAAFDEDALDDDMLDDTPFLNKLRKQISGLQSSLAAFILNRYEIGLRTTKDTLTNVNAFVLQIREGSWGHELFTLERKTMEKNNRFLKNQKIGRGDYSCWDIIVRNKEELVKLYFNNDFASGFNFRIAYLDKGNYYYSKLFAQKLCYGFGKSLALGKVVEIICDLFLHEMPYDCCEHMAYDFTNNELKEMIAKFQPPDFEYFRF